MDSLPAFIPWRNTRKFHGFSLFYNRHNLLIDFQNATYWNVSPKCLVLARNLLFSRERPDANIQTLLSLTADLLYSSWCRQMLYHPLTIFVYIFCELAFILCGQIWRFDVTFETRAFFFLFLFLNLCTSLCVCLCVSDVITCNQSYHQNKSGRLLANSYRL